MQYIGIAARSGLRPYCAVEFGGALERVGLLPEFFAHGRATRRGSAPADGALSRSPLHVTERSPRRLIVPSALTLPEFGVPIVIPYCCCTAGSDEVGSMRPSSIGGPVYSL